jgi:hypothetical protein
MGIKRFYATKDTTITNAYKASLRTRGSGSNMGASDVLETFSLYGQVSSASSELSRILVDFPIMSTLSSSRDDEEIPKSGSVNFYLKLYNAEHSTTTPSNFVIQAAPISQSWDEGNGLDMENYTDPGIGNGGEGATWAACRSGSFSSLSLNLDSAETEFVQVTDADAFTFSNATNATNGTQDSAFSISAWIYVDALGSGWPIVTKFDQSNTLREWNLMVAADGHISFEVYDENADKSASITSATSAIATGQWYHMVATYDGRGNASAEPHSGMKFYKNGVEVSQSTAATATGYVAMQNTSQTPWIGKIDNGSAVYSNGQIDEVSVWGRELSLKEIVDMYNKAVPTNLKKSDAYIIGSSDLLAWWRFEVDDVETADTTSVIQDHSGNGRTGAGQNLDAADLLTTNYAGIGKENVDNTALFWVKEGGTFMTGSSYDNSNYNNMLKQSFATGLEDLEIDVTPQVEEFLNHNTASRGFGIFISGSYETKERSYYTKRFFARGSQYFFKRPVLEARWDSSLKDDAGNFYISSSRVPAADNLNTVYLYNYVRGQLVNIPNTIGPTHGSGNTLYTGAVLLSLYSGTGDNTAPSGAKLHVPAGGGAKTKGDINISGAWVSTGIYSASFAYVSSSVTSFFPVWHTGSSGKPTSHGGPHAGTDDGSDAVQYYTGSLISYKTFENQNVYPTDPHVFKITNLRQSYTRDEKARFRVFARNKNWSPNVYSVATTETKPSIIEKIYYKISRKVDDLVVFNYGTGSTNHTLISYDASGSYFDFDMSYLEADFTYKINFLYNLHNEYKLAKEEFIFRVE